jgi:hypothetical protein
MVRYGEGVVSEDREAFELFVHTATGLLDEINARTGLGFLPKHFPLKANRP